MTRPNRTKWCELVTWVMKGRNRPGDVVSFLGCDLFSHNGLSALTEAKPWAGGHSVPDFHHQSVVVSIVPGLVILLLKVLLHWVKSARMSEAAQPFRSTRSLVL